MEESQLQSIKHYNKYGVSIAKVADDTIVIRQDQLVNNFILNQKQLVEIAKTIFPECHIKPFVFSFDVDIVTMEWIESRMKTYGIKKQDLIKQLAIEQSTLNSFIDPAKAEKIPNSIKALFFYYFLSYEINQDLRDNVFN